MSKQNYEVAREEVARLTARVAEHQAQVDELDAEVVRLEGALGEALADDGDTAPVEAKLAQTRTRLDGERQAVGVLLARLDTAKAAQRQAVAREMRRQAAALETENANVASRVRALHAELCELTGGPVSLDPNCRYVHDCARAERLRRSADMVERGLPALIADPLTSLPADHGLW